jgi:protein-L-isoaspartate(D-aspartate) O-methyltransferase
MNGPDERWRAKATEMVAKLGPLPPAVADAMRHIPRHRFVPPEYDSMAYEDEPLPISGSATISAPHMVAFQLEWSELKPGLKVLEIGSGLGYLAALMGELTAPSGTIDAVEIDPHLAEEARRRMEQLGLHDRVAVHALDGSAGLPQRAPFDRIVVSCAAPEIFPEWIAQLSAGGIVTAPVGDRWEQTMIRVRRTPGGPTKEAGPRVRFVPLLRSSAPIYRPAE